jgi:DNA-binding transcriptional regulator of glucitol operon
MNVPDAYLLLAAVVAGLVVQAALSWRQQRQFTRDVAQLRRDGTVAAGVAGKRYRGGRVYVVLSADRGGVVRHALQMRGFTTLTRARPFPPLIGRRVSDLAGPHPVEGLDKHQREATRQAAETLRQARKEAARAASGAPATPNGPAAPAAPAAHAGPAAP